MSKDSFTDEAFPPNENSFMGKTKEGTYLDQVEARHKLIRDSEMEWKRISDIVPKPVIFEDTINMDTIKYGRVSLPYFYSVLSALAKNYPSIFTKIILTKDYNPSGKYEIKLYIDGEFKTITIDDYFPCIKGTNVYFFTRPSNFEFWPLLIEKAWAKVNGGYLNIINLWPGDLFRALTGFSFDELIHPQLNKEELFNELNNMKNNELIFSLTTDNKEVEEKGLYIYHTYIVEDLEKVENVCLLKLRDPEVEANWTGDYSPQSKLWTDKLKSKLGKKFELKDGEFWMSLEDFHKLFIRTDACHMLTDGLTSSFKFTKDQLKTPKVFNLYVAKEGVVSVSVLEKNWHFHRELRNVSHPTSLIIAEYDSNKNIKQVFSKYENNEDLEITKTLKKGLYLVWAYKTTDPNEKFPAEEMNVKFLSLQKASVELVGDDVNFELARNIIFNYIKEQNKDKMKKDDFFYSVDNSFDKSGLGYQMVINPLKNIYQVWKVDSTATHGFLILPPHEKPDLELTVGYTDYQIILGIKRYKYGKHCLNLGIEATVVKGTKEPPKVDPKPNLDKFFSKNEKNFKELKEPTLSSSEIKKTPKFPTLNHWDLFLEKHKDKYPLIVEELKKLQPLKDEKFDLNIIEKNNNVYIGEADYGIRLGRGAYIFGREGTIYIGYWDNGLQFVRGKVFDKKNNKLIYEGEYKKGLKDGKGVYNYAGGEMYDGMFVKGLKEGKGIFTWSDGLKWEGTFKNDDLHGEGTFYDGKDSFKATFKDGDLVEN